MMKGMEAREIEKKKAGRGQGAGRKPKEDFAQAAREMLFSKPK